MARAPDFGARMPAAPPRFALLGAAGYIAPRHLDAIRHAGGTLVAAHDPHDSVGVLDAYAPGAAFFTEYERFDRHLERLRREGRGVDYLVVCSPNHLHDAHCRLGLRLGADVICEKPVTLHPWNLDGLRELERDTGRRVWCILQSRLHPGYARLRALAGAASAQAPARVTIHYVTPRGPWYRYSWKGDPERSGGVVSNIGVHLFDAVLSCFGELREARVSELDVTRAAGTLRLARAEVTWTLSVRPEDLPAGHEGPLRSFAVGGEAVDLSRGFEALHRESYARILAGEGFGLGEARPAIALVSGLRGGAGAPRA